MSKRLRKYKQISNDPSELTARSREIVEFYFANPKLTQKQIASHFGIQPSRISAVLNSKRVRAVYPALARRRINDLVPKAVSKYEELMEQKDNLKVSYDVATRVLESGKVLETPKIEINNTISVAPTEELVRIVEQSNNIRLNAIDAEVVEDEKPLLG